MIDPVTLYIQMLLTVTGCGFILFAIYRYYQSLHELRDWSLSNFCLAAGLGFLLTQNHLPTFVSFVLANNLLILGFFSCLSRNVPLFG